jgi:hypothetical protein
VNTLWIYDCDDPNLAQKLQGMQFDKCIIDDRVRLHTDVKSHIISRMKLTKNEIKKLYPGAEV